MTMALLSHPLLSVTQMPPIFHVQTHLPEPPSPSSLGNPALGLLGTPAGNLLEVQSHDQAETLSTLEAKKENYISPLFGKII